MLKGYWPCIEGAEGDSTKNLHAISAIGLLVEPSNYPYVQNCTTAKAAWDALETAFEDNGVLRRMDLLKYLMRLELADCASMEDYVNKMTCTQQKLDKSGTKIPDDIVAQIMLSGLPDEYRPMVMALANSGKALTTDLVRTNLLQEIRHEPAGGEAVALISKKSKNRTQAKKKRTVVCFECNEKGHYANKCPTKSKKETKNLLLASTSLVAKTAANQWFVDSGASSHMTMISANLTELREPKSSEVIVGNNGRLKVECAGDVRLSLSADGESKEEKVIVKDVLCIPNICANLMSVSQMAKQGKTLVFNDVNCRIFDKNAKLLASAPLVDDLYRLSCTTEQSAAALTATANRNLWHRRMGHACETNLNRIKSSVEGFDLPNGVLDPCTICAQGKQTRASFKDIGNRAKEILQIIHTDVCGPMSTKSLGGSRYLLTFVDDFSRKVFVYPIKRKEEVFNTFLAFKKLIENQLGSTIKILRSDNGKEFCNDKFKIFMKNHGIVHQFTAPYTPEQNGVAERMNRTIIEKVRCMLYDANLKMQFWAEAAATAAFLINRTPCRDMKNTTPEEIWTTLKPNLTHIRVFGCRAMVHIPKEKRRKLDPKSYECIFLGYCETAKAYKLYNRKTKKTVVSRDVIFFETKTPCKESYANDHYALKPITGNANAQTIEVNNEAVDSSDEEEPFGLSEGLSSHKRSENRNSSETQTASEQTSHQRTSNVSNEGNNFSADQSDFFGFSEGDDSVSEENPQHNSSCEM